MMAFSFASEQFAADFAEHGYVHIRSGISSEFLEYARRQLVRCRESRYNEIPAREIKAKKKQYLFDLPQDASFLPELFAKIAGITGSRNAGMTLSERHIMIYEPNAAAVPPFHKDRLASEFSIGIPLDNGEDCRIALYTGDEREINLLDRAIYEDARLYHEVSSCCPSDSTRDQSARNGCGSIPGIVELDVRPGDLVVFRGSCIYHGRLRSAGSSVLYFKLNTFGFDPLSEDPLTPAKRTRTLETLVRMSDHELLDSVVEVSRGLQSVTCYYSRQGWRSVLRAVVSGQPEFTISADDLNFLFVVDRASTVRSVLTGLGIAQEQLLNHLPRLRRLAMLGGIDLWGN